MSCGAIDPGNTFLWISLGGLFLGGGLSFLICPRKRRRPAVTASLLSIAVLSLLVSLHVYGYSIEAPSFRLYWLAGSVLLSYAGFLFWKAAGIPLLFLLVIFVSIVWYGLADWSCAEAGTEICSFRIISEGDDFRRIQYRSGGGEEEIVRIDGQTIAPRIIFMDVPEYFFILRSEYLYKFCGFRGSADSTICDYKSSLVDRLIKIPGLKKSEGGTESLNAAPSLEYKLVFGEEKKITLIRLLGQ